MFTVKQLSKLAGVTPRTLHHYDAIGLLKPSHVGENGYRYYGEESILRLQQILFYRELDLPLEEIGQIMGRRDFELLPALESHKSELAKRIARLERLIGTVDTTIAHLKGQNNMSKQQFFAAFTEEEERKYTAEAEEKYDTASFQESQRKWKSYSATDKQRIGEEGNQVYAAMVEAIAKGPDSVEAQAAVEHWRKHMDYFWTPTLEQLLALAEGYNSDPRFKANFDKIDPRLAGFMYEAVRVYVADQKK